MESEIQNRMATPAKRGRPSNAELAARTPAVPVIEVMVQPEPLPALAGILCPCCGRSMVPRIVRTDGNERTVVCVFTGRRMAITYQDSRPLRARLL